MFKVKIIAIGRSKEAWLNAAIAEYEKRLQGRSKIAWHFADDDKGLVALCKKEPLLIALAIEGEALNSVQFAEKWMKLGFKGAFVIGGPNGLPPEVLKRADFRWSLSPLTFTNQMSRLLVVEQLYRALEIHRGSPYHK
jgi:23S rRNA (pseudouridine1915-N3)-methyltransferase